MPFPHQMGLFLLVCVGLLAAFAEPQPVPPCGADTSFFTVASSEDAAGLASSLLCSGGNFSVKWIGEVVVGETIRVANGTSLNITGDEPSATADGNHRTQLFAVEGGSRLHFTDMTFANGSGSSGGAISADDRSLVSFSGTISFTRNDALDGDGGAIFAKYSTLRWHGSGDDILFMNSASRHGGAIYALWSELSWEGTGETVFFGNSASESGGAIHAHGSTVLWNRDGTQFRYNSANGHGSNVRSDGDGNTEISYTWHATDGGGAIYAYDSMLSWNGDGTGFSYNSGFHGGAIHAHSSTVLWDGDGTEFSFNSGEFGGALYTDGNSTVYWDGDGFQFRNNSAHVGGVLSVADSNVSWSGGGTEFIFNSAVMGGGGVFASYNGYLSWDGDGTNFSHNAAAANGGAIYMDNSALYWKGEGTHFISNVAHLSGGAIYVLNELLWFEGSTIFSNNTVGEDGGALAVYHENDDVVSGFGLMDWDTLTYMRQLLFVNIPGGSFIGNSAEGNGGAISIDGVHGGYFEGVIFESNAARGSGGAIYLMEAQSIHVEDVTFQSNSASNGGATAIYATDYVLCSMCNFLGNTATAGGGVDTNFGSESFQFSLFEGNSAGGQA